MTRDATILAALRNAERSGLSAAELAQHLGCSRPALKSHIDALRGMGYEIVAAPHQGYRLLSAPDRLDADEISSLLGAVRVVGRDIRFFRETTSTNDVVEKLARDGVREGVVVLADSQTRGRGRLGRRWISPAGRGLWFSVLLRPELRPQAATQLTVVAATALTRAIQQQTGLVPEIKWPNDILVRGRKLAGILTELSAELDRVKHVILGVGVDVNLATGDFPADVRRLATSVKIETGKTHRRADLAAAILRELDRNYARLEREGFAKLAEEWGAQCSTLGRRVRVRTGDRVAAGRAEALNEDGALMLRTDHGHLETILSGDVTLEKE
jgi:BirA family transcriptional regulator, biotin operon repressor / biotin---[acetyl-CoA-carboxylase] ligase